MAARLLAAAGILILLTGCFRYVPVEPAAAPDTARVRVQISPRAASEFAPVLGAPRQTLEGRLAGRTTAGLHIDIVSGEAGIGQPLVQRLVIPQGDLLGMQLREVDRPRTYATAAGAAALVGVIAYRAFSGFAGKTPEGTPGGGAPEVLLPLSTLRFR